MISHNGNHYRRDPSGWVRVYDEKAIPGVHVGTWALDEIERLDDALLRAIEEKREAWDEAKRIDERHSEEGARWEAEISRLQAELKTAQFDAATFSRLLDDTPRSAGRLQATIDGLETERTIREAYVSKLEAAEAARSKA